MEMSKSDIELIEELWRRLEREQVDHAMSQYHRDADGRMESWEYCQVSFYADTSVLNDYGKKGWEAVNAFNSGGKTTVLMKRRLEPSSKTP